MTPIKDATEDMLKSVEELNAKSRKYRNEGLPFSFVADPAEDGVVGVQVPVGRFTFGG